MEDASEVALSAGQLATLRDVLSEHDVRFAVLFGSATRPEGGPNDVDLAVEFETVQPGDEGYLTAYLDLHTTLEEELGVTVDLVDVQSADERFTAVIFEDGVFVYGSQERSEELAARVRDSYPSTEDARERVAAAVTRLKENIP
jgi:predicted nucleotidyltransferase